MSKFVASFGAAALLLAAASAARADEKLQGEWVIVSVTVNGMSLPVDEVKDGTMTFKGDKLIVTLGKDAKPDESTVSFGKSGDLLTVTVSEKDGKKHKGIYKLEDDGKKLTMAFSDGGAEPTKFEAPKPEKEGVENILFVLKKK